MSNMQLRLFTQGYGWKGDPKKILGFFQHPNAFSQYCTFVDENTGDITTGASPTAWQSLVMHAWETYRFINVGKPRQAKASEACMRVALKHTEYRPGLRSILCVNKDSVAEDLFRRVNDHYENQPAEVKVPLRSGEKRGTKGSLDFIHGGGMTIVSAQERAPSVGASPRLFWFSEFGKIPAERQKETVKNLLPGGEKKPDLMVAIESTPGEMDTPAYSRWLKALSGESRYYALFLEWLKSDEYRRRVEDGWAPNAVEADLMEAYGGTIEHARFIHDVWLEFDEDWDAVWNMYPRSETDGWEAKAGTVGFPSDILDFSKAVEDRSLPTICNIRGFYEFFRPTQKDGEAFEILMVVDPAGWSNAGDPTGILVFDEKARLLAAFMGKVDPTHAADMIEDVCAHYRAICGNPVTLAIESNKSDVITALIDRNREKRNDDYEFYNDRRYDAGSNTRGWYSTESKKKRAETRLAANIRNRRLRIPSKAVLTQLGAYDRSKAWKREGAGKDRHHFELAICALIAADIMVTFAWLAEAEVEGPKEEPLPQDPATAFVNILLEKSRRDRIKRRGLVG